MESCHGRALELHDVGFTYATSASPALQEVSLDIEAGKFVLLTGDTGSGKSTLLKLLKPEITPAGSVQGSIKVLGQDVQDFDLATSATSIGYVFQNPDTQVVCDSVWHEMAFGLENLGMDHATMRRRIAETCYFFGMEPWFRDATDTLSGGRKQLLALASVLVMRPRVLLLDEPTSQLDPIAEKNFIHALFRANKELGCTVVVATHNPRAMLEYADEAYEMYALPSEGVARPAYSVRKIEAMQTLSERTQLLDAPRDVCTHTNLAASAREVWFGYERNSWVLRGLDLDAYAGQIHALVGGNGSGKSTLLRVLAGTRRVRRGRVVNNLRDQQVLMPQDPKSMLVCERVDEELHEWQRQGGYSDDEVASWIEALGLRGLETHHPYDLSGGQQQLLAFGKLLLMKPKLLLLDEPTKGLDAVAASRMAQMIVKAAQTGACVVMASHDLNAVEQLADTVSMIFDGEIAATAPTREFFEGNVYYQP